MHILLVHQAFAALDEAGGTRHHELARFLVKRGHRVTIIASPVSYLTGKENSHKPNQLPEPGITILRAYTYTALHRSFIHRVISFLSFMLSSFFLGLGVPNVDLVWGTALLYIALLFLVAYYADQRQKQGRSITANPRAATQSASSSPGDPRRSVESKTTSGRKPSILNSRTL